MIWLALFSIPFATALGAVVFGLAIERLTQRKDKALSFRRATANERIVSL